MDGSLYVFALLKRFLSPCCTFIEEYTTEPMALVTAHPSTPQSESKTLQGGAAPALWRCYYDPNFSTPPPPNVLPLTVPITTGNHHSAVDDIEWNVEHHHVAPLVPAVRQSATAASPPRELAAMAYTLSGLFDGIVNCHAALGGGVPTPQSGVRGLCRYVLLLYHLHRTVPAPAGDGDTNAMFQSDDADAPQRRRQFFDLGHINATVMSLVSPTVLSVLIPTLKGHRRVGSIVKHIYSRLSEEVGAASGDADDEAIHGPGSRTAIQVSMLKAYLTEIISVTTVAALRSSSPLVSSTSEGPQVVRVVVPTSTGESAMDCVVPVANDVIRAVVVGECRHLRVAKNGHVSCSEFTSWLLTTSALLCTVPGGSKERSAVPEVEALLMSVMLPAARRVGRPLMPLGVPANDPDDVIETAAPPYGRGARRSPRTHKSTAATVDGSDSRAWIASRVPAMMSRPKPQEALHGTTKSLNDHDGVEGLQRVLQQSSDHTLEAKLTKQGALRLVDAYPMKLKQQPLLVVPPPPPPHLKQGPPRK